MIRCLWSTHTAQSPDCGSVLSDLGPGDLIHADLWHTNHSFKLQQVCVSCCWSHHHHHHQFVAADAEAGDLSLPATMNSFTSDTSCGSSPAVMLPWVRKKSEKWWWRRWRRRLVSTVHWNTFSDSSISASTQVSAVQVNPPCDSFVFPAETHSSSSLLF